MSVPEATRRLFFAFWPQDALQVALADATRSAVLASGGRPIPIKDLHVTLAFLGSVPEGRVPDLLGVANSVRDNWTFESPSVTCVELALDLIEYWAKPHLLCATARATSAPATRLVDALRADLLAARFAPDLKPFRAHVTLARKVPPGTHRHTMQSVQWRFADFALVESRTAPEGSLYSVLNSWKLYAGSEEKTGKDA